MPRLVVTGASKSGKSRFINERVLGRSLLTTGETPLPLRVDVVGGQPEGCEVRVAPEADWQALSLDEYAALIEELPDDPTPFPVEVRWKVAGFRDGAMVHERLSDEVFAGVDPPVDAVVVMVPWFGIDRPAVLGLRALVAAITECPPGAVHLAANRPRGEEACAAARDFLLHRTGLNPGLIRSGLPPFDAWRRDG